jgi:RNA polymerase sigma-70 factor, ECF subfamily
MTPCYSAKYIMTETELVRRILDRDRKSLAVFYKTYAPKLSRYLHLKIGNPEDAEEILSDTLYAFLEALRDFNGKASIQTFIFSICNHKIIDYYRRKKLKHFVFSKMPQMEALVSPLLSPEDEMESKLITDKIQRTFTEILPQYRSVLLFKYADNLSVSDIARKLAVTIKSAESVLFRARKAFVKAFVTT